LNIFEFLEKKVANYPNTYIFVFSLFIYFIVSTILYLFIDLLSLTEDF